MKLEFTFVLVLLAGGCLLWLVGEPGNSDHSAGNASNPSLGQKSSMAELAETAPPVVLAAWSDGSARQDVLPVPANQGIGTQHLAQPESPSETGTTGQLPATDRNTDPNADSQSAQQLLQQSASNLFHSTPIRAAARLKINMFGQKFVADGSYLQMGQGSGRTRMDFVFGDPNHPSRLLQVCDGRFHYSLASNDELSSLEFVDLLQIAQADDRQLIANPSTWMTTGGLPGLLQTAANGFEFQPVEESKLGDIPVFHLRGKWKKEYLKRIFGNTVNPNWIDNSMQWHQLPGQLPHLVEIYLGNDKFFPLFPYRIEFLQLQKDDQGTHLKRVFVFEMNEVNKLAEVSEDSFNVDYADITPQDVTEDFIRRVEQLNRPKQTARRNQKQTKR